MTRQVQLLLAPTFFCCAIALLGASALANLDEEELVDPSFLNIGGLACELAKCLKGHCVNTTSFPFYRCECNSGWQSPFGASWLPCILPNCSIDFTCANKTAEAPAPPPPVSTFSGGVCSLHVCGNGQCLQNTSSTSNSTEDDYKCDCDPGYVNFGNKTDGYCIRKCSIGADCTSVRLPFVHSPPPPAVLSPASSSSTTSNQGGGHKLGSRLLATTALVMAIMWR